MQNGGILSYTYELTDHLGNVRAVVQKKSNTADITNTADYYPGGMSMANRMLIGGDKYRFGYQGQFAEKDDETGYYTFQLRQYDSRIMRWLTPDPYGQYFSPYMSMGNSWANRWDPDGGGDCPPGVVCLDEIIVTPELTMTSINGDGNLIVVKNGKSYSFFYGGNNYTRYQRPDNLKYWIKNKNKFKNKDNSTAKFEDIFINKDEWWEEVITDILLEWGGVFVPDKGLSGNQRLVENEKYSKWRWNFPPRTDEEIKIREQRNKDIKERDMLRHLKEVHHLSTEDAGRLYLLENKKY